MGKWKNVHLLSFGIPILLMLGLFVVRGIFPFGKNSFMFSDMYHQYVPFLTEFWSKLHAGESLAFSWQVGLGSNFFAVYAYYLASPFNWLAFFCPESFLIEFMTYFIVLKIGLCGLTFSVYLSRRFGTKDLRIVWFSVFYAMSGFIAAYDWNHMWMDCIWLAPLVLLGLEELVKKGRYRLYCLALTASIVTNYYLSILLCIFLVFYFILQLFTNGLSIKRKCRAVFHFALTSLLAGGMAGAMLIPVMYAMHVTDFHGSTFPKKLEFYFNALEMIARHVPMLPTERGLDHWPNIYCGVLAFVLVPIYILHKKIPLKQKVGRILLLAFMLLSFSTNMLNFIWHGMNYPDSLPARQSFLYLFVVLTMCFEAVYRKEENGKWNRLAGAVGGLILLVACGIFAKTEGLTVWVMVCAWIFLAGYLILMVLFEVMAKRKVVRYSNWFILALVCVEAVLNMEATSVGTVQRGYYLNRKEEYRVLTEQINDMEDGFFRMDSFKQMTKNDGTLAGYHSASVFSSTINGRVEDFYDSIGMGGSKVSYYYGGATPLTGALFDVRYVFADAEEEPLDELLYEFVATEGSTSVYRCRYTLPMGFLMTENMVAQTEAVLGASGTNDISRQNSLSRVLIGRGKLLNPLSGLESSLVNDVLTVEVGQEGHLYAMVNKTPDGDVTFSMDGETKELKNFSRNYLLDLGWYDAGDSFQVTLEEEEDELSLRLYRLDMEVLEETISVLGEQSFFAESYTSDGLCGKIDAKTDGYLIISVPYEPSWEVWVDGERTDYTSYADTLLAISLKQGAHTVELRYVVRGTGWGFLCSAVSIVLFLVIYGRRRKG